ncbi:MAG: PAS domain-containing protein [Deltaproteobacteria bacterium]|nr:PAS domain-containing protein [Deltaproteobacteria bacterium]
MTSRVSTDVGATRTPGGTQAYLELALDASGAGTWSWDPAANVAEWDGRYHALYGFAPGEAPSYEGWLARIHPDDREHVRARVAALLVPGGGSAWNAEFRALHPEKGVRWMVGLGAVERDADGRATHFRGINLDVTERKRAEEALRENLERSEEVAHVGRWTWRLADNHVTWSPEIYRIFGLRTECRPSIEALARAIHPDDRARTAIFGRALLAGTVPHDVVECRVVTADGRTRHILSAIGSTLRASDGTIAQISGILHDVTARKVAEAEVVRAATEERRRIAADIHDGVLQELAGIGYLVASVRAALEPEAYPLSLRMRRIERLVLAALEHTRQLSYAMDPMPRGGGGLVAALRTFASEIAGTYGTACVVEHAAPEARVDDAVLANQLYCIAQEAVRNAVRHGKAGRIVVRLVAAGGEICLTVRDDGSGMPGSRPHDAGIGMDVMRYRAGLIGGVLLIGPHSEGGVEVRCRVACPTAAAELPEARG